MMGMINEAKEGLKDTLRNNDAIREEERVRMAEKTITLSSDDKYDSETSETSSEPASSSNKASTFSAEHITDNEETPLKKTHAVPSTTKKEVLELSKIYISSVAAMNSMNIYTYFLQNGYTYSNLKQWVTTF